MLLYKVTSLYRVSHRHGVSYIYRSSFYRDFSVNCWVLHDCWSRLSKPTNICGFKMEIWHFSALGSTSWTATRCILKLLPSIEILKIFPALLLSFVYGRNF